jgi:hypothetical protein
MVVTVWKFSSWDQQEDKDAMFTMSVEHCTGSFSQSN